MPLNSVWLLVLVSGLSLAGFGGWTSWELRRWSRLRHLRPVVTGWRLGVARLIGLSLCGSLAAAAVLAGVNRHFGYFPNWASLFGNISPDLRAAPLTAAQLGTPPPRASMPSHGVVEKVEIPGPLSGISRPAFVYLPPAYFDGAEPNRRFPVLYLIHGSPGTFEDWLRGGYVDRTMDDLLAHRSIQPFIVVLPDANGGYLRDLECQNVVGGPQDQTYLAQDVVSFVDQRYRTISDRLHRAIGGLSTGGYCGINLTFRDPAVFSAAVSHSGSGHPDQNFYTGDLFGGSQRLLRENSPDRYLSTIDIVQPTAVYMDDGANDTEALRANRRLFGMLEARGVIVRWNIVLDEGHTFVAFRRNLRLSLPWVSRWFTTHAPPSGEAQVEAPNDSYLPPPSLSDQGIGAGRGVIPATRPPTHSSDRPYSSDRRPAGSEPYRPSPQPVIRAKPTAPSPETSTTPPSAPPTTATPTTTTSPP